MLGLVPLSRLRPATRVVVLILIVAIFVGAWVIWQRGEETLQRAETGQASPAK